MKKLQNLKFAILLAATTLFTLSCSDDDKPTIEWNEYGVAVINTGINFVSVGSDSRTVVLDVDAKSDCDITADASWFSVDKTKLTKGKNTLTLTIENNPGEPRYADIKLKSNIDRQTLVVQQNKANTSYEDVTHNIYATFGTMPSLYAGLQLLTNDKTPSYFYFARENTYDMTQFPTHAQYVQSSNAELEKAKDFIKNTILTINKENPNAIFGLTVDDLRSRIGYDWFVAQGIDSSRVKVTLVSDGTGSYNEFYKYYGNPTTAKANWEKDAKEVDALEWDAVEATKVKHEDEGVDSERWMAYMSTLPNYRYFLQDGSLLDSEDPFIQSKIKEMNVVSIPPYEILNKLDAEKKAQFQKMAKFNPQVIEDMFKEGAKDQNLIIISTRPSSSIIDNVNKTIEQFQDQYNIYMSVHPADETSDLLDKLQEEGKVKLFPKGLPFEVLFWSFIDDIHAIGGAQSSVFLTVPVEKVKFMYADNAEGMVKPLDKIMAGQTHIQWMGSPKK